MNFLGDKQGVVGEELKRLGVEIDELRLRRHTFLVGKMVQALRSVRSIPDHARDESEDGTRRPGSCTVRGRQKSKTEDPAVRLNMREQRRGKQTDRKRSMGAETSPILSDPSLYNNRELSLLEFNQRVLEEAQEPNNPLLERLKFLCIVASNLDQFFEVRVAGLKQQRQSNISAPGPDGMSPGEQLAAISARVRQMVDDMYRTWNQELVPALEKNSIFFLRYDELTDEEREYYTQYFEKMVFPVLTPLAVDPVHPFPQLLNKSLNVAVELDGRAGTNLAVVQVPRILPRLLPYRAGEKGMYRYIFIGNLIQAEVGSLFNGVSVKGAYQFRVTRNSDLYLDEEETDNLLKTIELELRKRSRGDAVRLEVQQDCPRHIADQLLQTFGLTGDDLYQVEGPINFLRLMPVISEVDRPDLKFRPFVPSVVTASGDEEDIFSQIRRRPILLHHPYESFQTVLDFVEQAAEDPNVLAIKQTLYRTSGDSPIVASLGEAAREENR